MKYSPVTKHFLEIRFQPLPSILDKKGLITEALLNDVLDAWTINPTRIDTTSTKNKHISCFVTYANYGLTSESPNSTELFLVQAQALIKKMWTIVPPSLVQRFGLRTFQISPDKRDLEELVRLYMRFEAIYGNIREANRGSVFSTVASLEPVCSKQRETDL